MVAYINDLVFDSGLTVIVSNGQRVFITSTQPTTYPEATATYALGNAVAVVNAISDGNPTGRAVIVDAIAGGSVTGDGTAAFFCLVDDTNSRLLAAQAISNPQVVATGNTFSLSQWETRIPDPTV